MLNRQIKKNNPNTHDGLLGLKQSQTLNQIEMLESYLKIQRAQRIKKLRIFLITALAITAISLLLWTGQKYYTKRQFINQVPAQVRKDVDFPIYLPSAENLKINIQTFTYSSGVLTFYANSFQNMFTITEQKLSPNFDLAQFKTNQGMTEVRELQTPNGYALSGKVLNRDVLILVADGTLVTVVSSSQVGSQNLEKIFHSMNKL